MDQSVEALRPALFRGPGNGDQVGEPELLPEHDRVDEQASVHVPEQGDPSTEHFGDVPRILEGLLGRGPIPHRRSDDLLQEQRVPLGLGLPTKDLVLRRGPPTLDPTDKLGGFSRPEGTQEDRAEGGCGPDLAEEGPAPCVAFRRARNGGDDREPGLPDAFREVEDRFERGSVGELEVVDRKQERVAARGLAETFRDANREFLLCLSHPFARGRPEPEEDPFEVVGPGSLGRWDPGHRRMCRGLAREEREEIHRHPAFRDIVPAQGGGGRQRLHLGVEEVAHERERGREFLGQGASEQNPEAQGSGPLDRDPKQVALSDPRRSRQEEPLADSAQRLL